MSIYGHIHAHAHESVCSLQISVKKVLKGKTQAGGVAVVKQLYKSKIFFASLYARVYFRKVVGMKFGCKVRNICLAII